MVAVVVLIKIALSVLDQRVRGGANMYRVTSLVRERTLLGPYRSPVPRALRWSYSRGGGCFLRARYPCTQPERTRGCKQVHAESVDVGAGLSCHSW